MFSFFSHWRHQRIIKSSSIPINSWRNAVESLPLIHHLTPAEHDELRRLAILFLHYKSLEGAKDLDITEHMSLVIALQACLPILHLGIDWYRGWVSVIVYPAAFVPGRTYQDEYGIEHRSQSVLTGEAWHRGPVILSWQDSEHAGKIDGDNLVIHEFAHKLDLLNGVANGFPPLHRNMDREKWSEILSSAFRNFQQRMHTDQEVPVNHYAASSPAEFFAVLSEVFFEQPALINDYYPDVYNQFSQFYKQDTLSRLPRITQ